MYILTSDTSVSMMSFPSCAFRKPCIPGVALLYLNSFFTRCLLTWEMGGKKIGCHSKGFSTHLPKVWYFWSVYFLFCFVFNFQWCLFHNKEGLLIPSVGLIWEAQFMSPLVWTLCEALTWLDRFTHMRSLSSPGSPTLVFIPCSELRASAWPFKYWSVSCDLEAALSHRHSPFIHHSFMV